MELHMPESRNHFRSRKWMAALIFLAGVISLVGIGAYFYGRFQPDTAKEYDGVLVKEIQREPQEEITLALLESQTQWNFWEAAA